MYYKKNLILMRKTYGDMAISPFEEFKNQLF